MIKFKKTYFQLFLNKASKTFSSVDLIEFVKRKNKNTLLSLTFLIFSFFVLHGCGGKSNYFGPGYGTSCSDYIIDVRPLYSHQTEGQEINGHITGEGVRDRFRVEEVILGVGGDTISLDLEFNVRQQASYNYNSSLLTVIGEGDDRSFDFTGGFRLPGTNTPFNLRWNQDRSNAITGVIKDAVRDGYKNLNESLGSYFPESISSPIGEISGNQARISLGRSDYIQEGDVFYIYPGTGGYGYNSSCHNRRRQGPALATASVLRVGNKQAILEITSIQNTQRQIQSGDIAEISQDTDIQSRYETIPQRQQDTSQINQTKRRSIKIGFVPRVILTYRDESRRNRFYGNRGDFYRRDISPFIRSALVREAREFGFQIVQ